MQAVISLCYFCENHGPRIVMTCQPKRNYDTDCSFPLDDAMETEEEDETPRFYGDTGQEEMVDEEERCAACSSFGNGLGILSNDHEAETSYVSTQMPMNEKLYQMVKQACLRSLSVEISTPLFVETGSSDFASTSESHLDHPKKYSCVEQRRDMTAQQEKDGVVLFGDDENGYTLSMTFRLRDAKARGFNRSYSLIVLSHDKLMLLSNYEFFLGGFSAIISKLQSMAKYFFSVEQQMDDNDLRLATNVNRAQRLPHQFYPKNFVLDTSRSLTVIANNKEIFTVLHRQMLYLLKTQTVLERDIVLEGVPTQDMLVIMEMEKSSLEENDLVCSLNAQQSLFHLYNLRIIVNRLGSLGENVLIALLWQVIVGGQIVVKSDYLLARKLFLLALGSLLPIGCIRLASNAAGYIHNYKSNFLGCPPTTAVPEEVSNEVFVIRMRLKECLSAEQNTDDMESFDFEVEACPTKAGPKPSILVRYLELLFEPEINVSTLDSALRATKCDWLNNAKLIFQLRHQKDRLIDIHKIIRIIKCGAQDSPVLLFWQSGLSRRYKQVVLNTINTSSRGNTNSNGVNRRIGSRQ